MTTSGLIRFAVSRLKTELELNNLGLQDFMRQMGYREADLEVLLAPEGATTRIAVDIGEVSAEDLTSLLESLEDAGFGAPSEELSDWRLIYVVELADDDYFWMEDFNAACELFNAAWEILHATDYPDLGRSED